MAKQRSSLYLRTVSTLVYLPAVLALLWMGGWWFFGLIAVVCTAATWEYVRMLRLLQYRPTALFAMVLGWAVLLAFHLSLVDYFQPVLAGLLVGSLAWHLFTDRTRTPVENWLLPLAGALYITWTGAHFLSLRALDGGAYRLMITLAITWIADAGAYFVGRTWGRRPLSLRLSPKKTWEGYAGGVVSGTIGGLLLLGLGGLGWGHGAALGLLLSAVTPLGDLGVSMIKRQAGVKDSGRLFPGHGGALDRLDSVLIGAVVAYYYQVWAMGALAAT